MYMCAVKCITNDLSASVPVYSYKLRLFNIINAYVLVLADCREWVLKKGPLHFRL
jgi:hypothetical protein